MSFNSINSPENWTNRTRFPKQLSTGFGFTNTDSDDVTWGCSLTVIVSVIEGFRNISIRKHLYSKHLYSNNILGTGWHQHLSGVGDWTAFPDIERLHIYRKISNISRTKSQIFNVSLLVLQLFCAIYWSQVLSREWRCSWSSGNRRKGTYLPYVSMAGKALLAGCHRYVPPCEKVMGLFFRHKLFILHFLHLS